MKIKIFTLTHKKFEVPKDNMYVPLQVGREGKANLGYLCDNTGENISAWNCYYSELTGFYWIWKNEHDCEYVGTCHYRRYLLNEQGKIFTEKEYLALLKDYDVITTRRVVLNNSYHYGFSANHNILALDTAGEVIKELYPEYYQTFSELVNGPETYFGNMLVTAKPLFDDYCKWLFSIFFEVQKRINLETGEDDYHKRVFGFISEFLLLVWVRVNRLTVYECKVGMLGEKAETHEMKEQLAAYFCRKDIAGAKAYFMECLKKRPDVLMEASDITGELRLCMQIVATADAEQKETGHSVFDRERRFPELIKLFTKLNTVIAHYREKQVTQAETDFLRSEKISRAAVEVAIIILPVSKEEKEQLRENITKDI